MFTNYYRHLFVLAIAFICLLLLPIINCTNDHDKKHPWKKISYSIVQHHLNRLLKQEKFPK